MHRSDRAGRSIGGHCGKHGAGEDAIANFLPLHIATGLEGARRLVNPRMLCQRWVARLLSPRQANVTGHKEARHDEPQGPALFLVAYHPPESIGQRRGDGEYRKHLQEVREACRVLERVCAIRVEGAAPVIAQVFNGFLGSKRPADDILGPTL